MQSSSTRPIFFVDYDGSCLNTFFQPVLKRDGVRRPAVVPAIRNLFQSLVEEFDGQIVICSAWRVELPDKEQHRELLGEALFARLHEDWKTDGGVDEHRGNEVLRWVEAHGYPPHLIIDDDRDFYTFQPLLRTDSMRGLTEWDVKLARTMIKAHGPVGGIDYLFGDLVTAQIKLIAHGCNAQGKMGKGVAKAIRDRYPDAFTNYMRAFVEEKLTLGGIAWYEHYGPRHHKPEFFEPGRWVANVITQKFYGNDGKRYVDYLAVETGLTKVAKRAVDVLGVREVGIPMIGAGLAGGKWDIIENIVNDIGVRHGVRFTVVINDQEVYNKLSSGVNNDAA